MLSIQNKELIALWITTESKQSEKFHIHKTQRHGHIPAPSEEAKEQEEFLIVALIFQHTYVWQTWPLAREEPIAWKQVSSPFKWMPKPHLVSAFCKRTGRRAGSAPSLLLQLSYLIIFFFWINFLAIRLQNYPLYVHWVCLQGFCRLRDEPWLLSHLVWMCPHLYHSKLAPPAEGWLQPYPLWTQKKTSLLYGCTL